MNQEETAAEKKLRYMRIGGLYVLAYLVMMSYAIARPAVESIFLHKHGYSALPIAWLLVALGALSAVLLYNRYASRVELARLFGWICAVSALILLALLCAHRAGVPGTSYALYVWKDIYIVVLVETFWSFANAVFPIRSARWLYGTFCMMGSLGSISGNLLVGKLARTIGTNNALWWLLPLLLLMGVGCWWFARVAGYMEGVRREQEPPRFTEGFQIVRKSQYLWLMLLLIATTQIAVTLIDYQFNQAIQQAYPQKDLRTDMIGKVYTAIAIGSFVLEMLTGLIFRLFGITRTLLSLPILLGFAVGGFVLLPHFLTMAFAKASSKALDYSLFRAGKEILYIPLSYEEKTQGKAVVDILTYRVAKGLASLMLLLIGFLGLSGIVPYLSPTMIALWFVLTWLIVKRYRQETARNEGAEVD